MMGYRTLAAMLAGLAVIEANLIFGLIDATAWVQGFSVLFGGYLLKQGVDSWSYSRSSYTERERWGVGSVPPPDDSSPMLPPQP